MHNLKKIPKLQNNVIKWKIFINKKKFQKLRSKKFRKYIIANTPNFLPIDGSKKFSYEGCRKFNVRRTKLHRSIFTLWSKSGDIQRKNCFMRVSNPSPPIDCVHYPEIRTFSAFLMELVSIYLWKNVCWEFLP